jgi:hypothetical protein
VLVCLKASLYLIFYSSTRLGRAYFGGSLGWNFCTSIITLSTH